MRLLLIYLFLMLFCENAAFALEKPRDYQELLQEVRRLDQANRLRDQIIKNLIVRIESLEKQLANSSPASEPAPATLVSEDQKQELVRKLRQEAEENYRLIQNVFEQRLSKEGGMLLAPWQLIYEPSVSYSHASYDRVVVDGFTIFPVLVVGDIVSEQVRRDVFISNHSLRLGLPYDLQVDLLVPFGYEKESTFRGDGTYEANDVTGLGDISLGLSHQLIKGNELWPDTLLGLNWKSASGRDPYRLVSTDELALGSGFNTLGLSLTAVTSADPAVLYAGLSGTYSLADTKTVGRVNPGESYGLNLGMALALNLDTSLSFNLQYRYTLETEIEGQPIRGSNLTTASFGLGLSKGISERISVDFDLGLGLTRDSPDLQVVVSLPIKFSLVGGK